MYYYNNLVDHLKQIHPKESAAVLDKIFLSLVTDYMPCDCFVEAGAFEASASMFVKSKNKNCQVHAFEANIDNFNHFKNKIGNINYLCMAVADYTGNIIFKQQSHTSDGYRFPTVKGNNSIKTRVRNKNTIYNDVAVPCTTLDDYFKNKLRPDDSIGIWLDLEGTAYEALTKSTDTLSQVSFIKIEVEDRQYWKNQKLSKDIVEFLNTVNIVPLFQDFENKFQYNILFAKQKFVNQNLKNYIESIITL